MENLVLIWKHKSSLCSYCYIRRFSLSLTLNLTCMPSPPVYCKSLLSVPSTCIIVKLSPVISGYSHCVCNWLLNLQRPKSQFIFFLFVCFRFLLQIHLLFKMVNLTECQSARDSSSLPLFSPYCAFLPPPAWND